MQTVCGHSTVALSYNVMRQYTCRHDIDYNDFVETFATDHSAIAKSNCSAKHGVRN